jgi:hypothetical protein
MRRYIGITITHPLPPLKEGRAGRRSAVIGNTGCHLIILNSPFSILNSKEGRTEQRSIVFRNTGSHLIILVLAGRKNKREPLKTP